MPALSHAPALYMSGEWDGELATNEELPGVAPQAEDNSLGLPAEEVGNPAASAAAIPAEATAVAEAVTPKESNHPEGAALGAPEDTTLQVPVEPGGAALGAPVATTTSVQASTGHFSEEEPDFGSDDEGRRPEDQEEPPAPRRK